MFEYSSKTRKRYDPNFKLFIILKNIDEGIPISQLARNHNINHQIIRRWKREYQRDGPNCFDVSHSKDFNITAERERSLLFEISRLSQRIDSLEKENRRLMNLIQFREGK